MEAEVDSTEEGGVAAGMPRTISIQPNVLSRPPVFKLTLKRR